MTKWSTMLLAGAVAACVSTGNAEEKKVPAALNFKMKAIDGKDVDLAKKYAGKVVLVVNVASYCRNTPQYKELEALHEKYGKDGLAVVGVPCNQFGKQEPGSNEEIVEFCKSKYDVKFDLLSKVDVNGDDACPLYKHLTAVETKPKGAGKVSWNFEKFVIGKSGDVVARFDPRTKPDAPDVVRKIEEELKK